MPGASSKLSSSSVRGSEPRRKNGCVAGFVASTQSKAKSGAPAAAGQAGVKMAKLSIVLRTYELVEKRPHFGLSDSHSYQICINTHTESI